MTLNFKFHYLPGGGGGGGGGWGNTDIKAKLSLARARAWAELGNIITITIMKYILSKS